jgi:hypothetical protein
MADNEEKITGDESSDLRAAEADQISESTEMRSGGGGNSVVVSIIAILLLIGGLIFLFATRKPVSKMATMLEILPQDNVMLASVDLSKVEDTELKNNLWNKIKESEAFKQFLAEFELEQKINLEEDVLSWIGESVSVSVFDTPNTAMSASGNNQQAKAGEEPRFVIIVSMRDKEKAKTKVPEILQKSGVKYTEKTYEGVDYWNPDKKEAPVVAFLKDKLLLGSSAAEIQSCVDALKGKTKSLKDNEQVIAALNKLPPNSVVKFYADISRLALEGPGAENLKDNPEAEKFIKGIRGLAVGMAMKKNGDITGTGFLGIDKQAESIVAKALLETRTDIGVPSTAKLFPKDTTQYAAFDVKYLYGILSKIEESKDGGMSFQMVKESLKAQANIDLDKDVFDSLSGEAAYSINMLDVIKQQMGQAMETQSRYEMDLVTIAESLERHSTDKNGKYPGSLGELTPQYLEKLPEAPKGTKFLYKKSDNPPSFRIGYTTDGKSITKRLPSYDSNMGMTPDPNKPSRPQAPIVIAIKLKDKARIQEVMDKLVGQSQGMLDKQDYAGVKLFIFPQNSGGFGVYEDYLLIGIGAGIDKVKTIIDNKLDESKALSSLDSFKEIQGKLGKDTISVGFISVESVMPIIELGVLLAAAQKGPENQQFTREILDFAKQYKNMWTYSEIDPNGIKFDFNALKDKADSKK